MKSLQGTQTEKNLMSAFAGESQARNRYTFFASKAKKEGYEQIAEVFTETANQEKEHAERLFKFLQGGMVEVIANFPFPAGVIGSTAENLKEAAAGEHEEWYDMYPSFAKIAEAEGFAAIAYVFRNIAIAEKAHEDRYLTLMDRVLNGEIFFRKEEITWQCRNCGFVTTNVEAPISCPACAHHQAYFEQMKENF